MQEDPNGNTQSTTQDVNTSFGPQADAVAAQRVGQDVQEGQVVVDAGKTMVGSEPVAQTSENPSGEGSSENPAP